MRTKKLTGIEMAEVEMLRKQAAGLSPKQQFRLAYLIAESIHHLIVPAHPHDEWQRDKALLEARGEIQEH